MKKKIRMVLIVILAAVFVVSMGAVIRNVWDTWKGEESRAEAEELVGLPDLSDLSDLPQLTDLPELPAVSRPPEDEPDVPPQEESPDPEASKAPERDPEELLLRVLMNMDLSKLQEVNADVIGWIAIPGTNISYPMVQGQDNDYYLEHSWKREYSSLGSIFVDYENAADLSGFNTLVYGHRMRSGAMFGELRSYGDPAFWTSAPSIYIVDSAGVLRYDIFAAYEVPVTGMTYEKGLSSDREKQDFINYCVRRSVFDAGITPDTEDCILTLSTCSGSTYATRWIVQAVLSERFPPAEEGENLS